ncbi:gamma-aminobutyric acid receptor subunit pi-like [Oppia nitens]|uniref:gamma-aminobutyric acid receptor subunit pi-like n=1 Tax=Oppia nitens TaxID=1686743 RepID=UPI0023DBBE84|nr:gamma-aminobutyric acid receptor subunit pi-like [Oppia nitens]
MTLYQYLKNILHVFGRLHWFLTAALKEKQYLSPKLSLKSKETTHSFKVSCHMNLQTYPMDRHTCQFNIRTFSEPIERIGKYKKQIIKWFNENYTVLDLEFIFERRITANVLTVYIPSSLVVTLSWIQFWFDVEAVPGRMSLGIMSTLTIMTQILTNYEKAANHVTAVDIWLLVCLIMVFLALMEYAFAYTISHYYDIDGNLKAKNSFKKNVSLILHEFRANKIRTSNANQSDTLEDINNDNKESHLFTRKITKDNTINDNKEVFLKDENRIKSLQELSEVIHSLIKSFGEMNNKLEANSITWLMMFGLTNGYISGYRILSVSDPTFECSPCARTRLIGCFNGSCSYRCYRSCNNGTHSYNEAQRFVIVGTK